MEHYILNLFTSFSYQSIIIASITFIVTMIIKTPIKKFTSLLTEEKRKGINSIIILIPLMLSIIISFAYYIIIYNIYFNYIIIETAINSWIISLSIYAIYNRIKIIAIYIITIIKDKEITTKSISDIDNNLKDLNIKLKSDEKVLNEITVKIHKLLENKIILKQNNSSSSLNELYKTNIEIESLNNKKNNLETQINELKKYINTLINETEE